MFFLIFSLFLSECKMLKDMSSSSHILSSAWSDLLEIYSPILSILLSFLFSIFLLGSFSKSLSLHWIHVPYCLPYFKFNYIILLCHITLFFSDFLCFYVEIFTSVGMWGLFYNISFKIHYTTMKVVAPTRRWWFP